MHVMNLRAQRGAGCTRRRATLVAALVPVFLARKVWAQEDGQELGLEPDNPLQPIAAKYQSLGSYQDTGTVVTLYQWPGTPLLEEHHRFETAFRTPRNFFFRFDADPASGGDVYVIWCDGGPFQSWWKATGTHTVHDNGQGAVAFFAGQSASKDAANLVAPFFFPQADLVGPAYRLIPPVTEESDTLDGRNYRKISAAERVSGTQTREHRPSTIWIDDETLLIRKVLVEPDAGSDPDLIDEKTFLVDAQANPELPDSRFTFTPPE